MKYKRPDGQIERRHQKLQQFDYDVIPRTGKSHRNADALSRRPCIIEECTYCLKVEAKEDAPDNTEVDVR